jgi:hypothetical protein
MRHWRALILGLSLLTLVSVPGAYGQGTETEVAPPSVSVTLYGPFVLHQKSFTVKVTELTAVNRLAKSRILMWEKTVSEILITDQGGKIHFEERYDVPLHSNGFEYSISIQAHKLEGSSGEGIILKQDAVPSAPGSGRAIRIFALTEGLLKPVSPWLTVYGGRQKLLAAGDSTLRLPEGDRINFSVWAMFFGVVVPVSVDLEGGTVSIPEGINSYRVEAEGPIFLKDPEPVPLYLEPTKSTKTVTVSVSRESRIQYLEARTRAGFFGERVREVGISEPWLKVRVDGVEGWVTGNNGFISVGLTPAG